jgi:hypothetical protein
VLTHRSGFVILPERWGKRLFTIGPPLWGGAATDPFFASVVLLMQFDGNLTDVKGNIFAADGTSFTSTNAQFGQSLDVGGTATTGGGSNVVYMPTASITLDMGNSDFTIEGAMLFKGVPNRPRTLIRVADDSSAAGVSEFQIVNDGGSQTFQFVYRNGAVSSVTSNGGSSVTAGNLNTWNHCALCRQGDTYYIWVNGVGGSTGSPSSYRPTAGNKQVFIGNSQRAFVDGHYGLIDSVRITKGVARYTAAFTPPTAAFPNS